MTVFSTTAINAGLQCLKKFEYSQVLKLRPNPKDVSVALRRGTWIHHALQHHHQGDDWRESLDRLIEWADTYGIDYAGILEETETIMSGYVAFWEKYQEHPWTVIASEDPVSLEIPGGHSLRATLDTVVEERGELWLLEHKSTTRIPNQEWRVIDPQTAVQMIVSHGTRKYDVVGVIFNYLYTEIPSVPRVKKDGSGFYANSARTTSKAFEEGAANLREVWSGTTEDFEAYVETKRMELANDGAYYQRYYVRKPMPVLRSTLQDVAVLVKQVEDAERTGYYRRSQNQIMCPQFCTYSKLCALEFSTGRIAQIMRETDFVTETEDLKAEGRW